MIDDVLDVDLDGTVLAFWRDRLALHTRDTYKGRTLAKMPEDLRTYQHVIERTRPDLIIELGTYDGGSALWFADQLQVLCDVQGLSVITVEKHPRVKIEDPRVLEYRGVDLADKGVIDEIGYLAANRRVMVVEDSAHTYESTLAALNGYGEMVSLDCYFVVEDGVVDEPRLTIWNGGGVQPAITDFLNTELGSRFSRHELAPYGLTTDHHGWLRAGG